MAEKVVREDRKDELERAEKCKKELNALLDKYGFQISHNLITEMYVIQDLKSANTYEIED